MVMACRRMVAPHGARSGGRGMWIDETGWEGYVD
jgi:hypothetical protein